ncbi:7TM diverse intracellular signaling domain-containing protein [Roseivirga sp. BDSF3-8]|uniref:7TM diverse intracellular signaling domain-containing protein n=1 Tax=Roseivirga sp. BDSF3-8 TaxID=3241598 RepID=UPI0035319327
MSITVRILLFTLALWAYGLDPVYAQTEADGEAIITCVKYLHDANDTMRLESLPAEGWSDGYPYTHEGSVWTAMEIVNEGNTNAEVVLPVGNIPVAVLYLPDGRKLRTGVFLPVEERSYAFHSPIFSFTVAPGRHSYFMKLQTKGRIAPPQSFTAELIPAKAQLQAERNRLFSQGLFIGIILVMALYNFSLYLTVRDISYLYYVLSIMGIGLYFMFYYGFTREYLWPGAPVWDAYSFAFIVPLTGLARIMFTRSYLHTSRLLPLADKFLKLLFVLYMVPLGMGGGCLLLGLPWYEGIIDVIGVLGTMVLATMLVAGVITWYGGYTPALFFTLANVLFVLGTNVFIFKEMGLYEDNFVSRYAAQVGVIAQVVLFSLGLAYRLKRARQEAAEQKLAAKRMELEKEAERKQLIEKQKAELERTVAERTQELRESIDRLQESETGLRQLNKVKDKLFSVVSHDLRGPVATLDSFINIITHHAASVTPEELLLLSGKTRQSVNNLSFLLDNLLNWSRSQMGTLVYNPESFTLREVVQQNIELHTPVAETKKITLVANVHPQLAVVADRSMTDFIIRNLLSNAIKFTKPYGTVKISAAMADEQVQVMVTDTGIGMPQETLDRIMEPESTYSTRGTHKEPGTGLGLLLVKEFLEKHGAVLCVESREGEGSSFSFLMSKDREVMVVDEVY